MWRAQASDRTAEVRLHSPAKLFLHEIKRQRSTHEALDAVGVLTLDRNVQRVHAVAIRRIDIGLQPVASGNRAKMHTSRRDHAARCEQMDMGQAANGRVESTLAKRGWRQG